MGAAAWIGAAELDGTWSTDENAEEAILLASELLWSFSGRKYARVREVTETYECACESPDSWLLASRWLALPVLDAGAVRNMRFGECGCESGPARLRLRGTPVRSVQEVRVGSEVLDPDTYRMENYGLLTMDSGVPGGGCGVTVTYSFGTGIPPGGRVAAKLLAQEFLKSWSGDDECRLPDRVTNVSRQGISFTVLDRQEFLDELRTGIYEVDLFLRSVNPDRARKPARVFSPDVPKAHRTTSNFPPPAPPAPIDNPVMDGGVI